MKHTILVRVRFNDEKITAREVTKKLHKLFSNMDNGVLARDSEGHISAKVESVSAWCDFVEYRISQWRKRMLPGGKVRMEEDKIK